MSTTLVSIFIICCFLLALKQRELFFEDLPLLKFNLTLDPTQQFLYIPPLQYDKSLLIDFVPKLLGRYKITESKNGSTVLLDNTSFFIQLNNAAYQLLTCTNEKHICCFIKSSLTLDNNHISSLVASKIGYIDSNDLFIIKAIFNCYDLPMESKYFVQITDYNDAKTKLDTKVIKAFFLFSNTLNPLLKAFKDYKLSIYNFDDINQTKIKFILPFAAIMNYDFKLLFPKYQDKFTVKTSLSFDNIILVKPYVKPHILLDELVYNYPDNFDKLNFYTKYITPHPTLNTALQKFNLYQVTDKSNLNILEKFSAFIDHEPSIAIIVTTPIKTIHSVIYSNAVSSLKIQGNKLNNIPLNEYDKVIFKAQHRDVENGIYYVINTNDVYTTLMSAIPVFTYKIVYKNPKTAYLTSEKIWPKGTKLYLMNDKKLVQITNIDKDVQEILVINTIIDDPDDPRYTCVTNQNISIKGLCLSEFDVTGKKKKRKDIWDKPCDKNEECPFFQSNSTYQNYRGGCSGGYCEVPIGINRVGFRYFIGTPYCHGCPDKTDPKCCDKQRQPNYAFPLDEYERKNESNF
jgi:hypothetical protein